MGNAKSTTCTNGTSVQEQDLKLTDYDMTIYEYRKEKIFKGTIAVCILYAFIALLILTMSYISPTIKFVVFEKFLPFTVVFIIGTILLIIYLFYNIINFKPIKINKNFDYTNISCPDYWTLEYNEDLSKYFDSNSINTNIFNYRCVPDSNVFSKTDLYFNRKNQLGIADNAIRLGTSPNIKYPIGMTGFNNNKLDTYTNINKDSIDTDNSKYIVADIKDDINKEIINKITGTFDSNVYKNLVESSLLMNNYYFDSNASKNADYNIYKHLSTTNGDITKNGFDTTIVGSQFNQSSENKSLNLKIVNSDVYDDASTSKLSSDHQIQIKKNINDNSGYLDNIVFNTGVDAGGTLTTTNTPLQKIPLVCNRVYPLLLSAKDKELSKNSSGKYDENVLRCAYSKMCGIPWSDMNCDKYNI